MTTRSLAWMKPDLWTLLGALTLLAAGAALAQTPVDEGGNAIAGAEPVDPGAPVTDLPQRSMQELDELVGPIALYPDDLLAIVLPASTYPLEVVQAARFLERRERNADLEPDESWDESVVALLNYPEVLKMMSEDIDWTWELGEAVVAQQGDVIAAVEAFRDRAYAAGNLESDERQTVTRNDDDVIEIEPVEDEVIYVPYYEPEKVVVHQPRRVYHYYPRAYPVYYYPYPVGHRFLNDYFWGVSTAFTIGWTSNWLHVYHHSFHGHPYFGHHYHGRYWRQPSIYVFNTHYGYRDHARRADRYRHGSYWRPRYRGGARPNVSVARSRFYSNNPRSRSEDGYADERRDDRGSGRNLGNAFRDSNQARPGDRAARRDHRRSGRDLGNAFRDRDRAQPGDRATRRNAARGTRGDRDDPIRFRDRDRRVPVGNDLATRHGQRDAARDARRARAGNDASSSGRSNVTRGNPASERSANRRPLRHADPIAESRRQGETIARGQARRESMARSSRFGRTQPSTSSDSRRSSPSTFSSSSRRSSADTSRRARSSQRATAPRASTPSRRSSSASPGSGRSSASSGSRRSSSSSSSSSRRSASPGNNSRPSSSRGSNRHHQRR